MKDEYTTRQEKRKYNLNKLQPNDKIQIVEKEKPNFEPSGLLAKQTNSFNGVVLKFTLPQDSSMPTDEWRLYTFKESDDNSENIFIISSKECYLIGKDDRVADIQINHSSCSRQHAVIQFRKKLCKNRDGEILTEVNPYIMDLESTNGTFLNKEQIEPACYIQLRESDVLNFGQSKRDYILMKYTETFPSQ